MTYARKDLGTCIAGMDAENPNSRSLDREENYILSKIFDSDMKL